MHATSDIDVRSAPTPGRQVRALGRREWLARPLLILLASMPACVVPVSPTFQDPPPQVSGPPYISSATPAIGNMVTIQSNGSQQFSVDVNDATFGATMYYRWAFDFPPFDAAITRSGGPPQTILPRADGQPSFATILFTLDCTILPDPSTGSDHKFTLILTDRPFSTDAGQIDQIKDPTGHAPTLSTWYVNMSCQVPSSSATVPP